MLLQGLVRERVAQHIQRSIYVVAGLPMQKRRLLVCPWQSLASGRLITPYQLPTSTECPPQQKVQQCSAAKYLLICTSLLEL
jgi:hypothetical protein